MSTPAEKGGRQAKATEDTLVRLCSEGSRAGAISTVLEFLQNRKQRGEYDQRHLSLFCAFLRLVVADQDSASYEAALKQFKNLQPYWNPHQHQGQQRPPRTEELVKAVEKATHFALDLVEEHIAARKAVAANSGPASGAGSAARGAAGGLAAMSPEDELELLCSVGEGADSLADAALDAGFEGLSLQEHLLQSAGRKEAGTAAEAATLESWKKLGAQLLLQGLRAIRGDPDFEPVYYTLARRGLAFCVRHGLQSDVRLVGWQLRTDVFEDIPRVDKSRGGSVPATMLKERVDTAMALFRALLALDQFGMARDVLLLLNKQLPEDAVGRLGADTVSRFFGCVARLLELSNYRLLRAYALWRQYRLQAAAVSIRRSSEGDEVVLGRAALALRKEEDAALRKLATRAILAAIAAPLHGGTAVSDNDANYARLPQGAERSRQRDAAQRLSLAQLLRVEGAASRPALLREVVAGGLLAAADPRAAELFVLSERFFGPRQLGARAAEALKGIEKEVLPSGSGSAGQQEGGEAVLEGGAGDEDRPEPAVGLVRRQFGLRVITQAAATYSRVRVARLVRMTRALGLGEQDVLDLIVGAVQAGYLAARIHEAKGFVAFVDGGAEASELVGANTGLVVAASRAVREAAARLGTEAVGARAAAGAGLPCVATEEGQTVEALAEGAGQSAMEAAEGERRDIDAAMKKESQVGRVRERVRQLDAEQRRLQQATKKAEQEAALALGKVQTAEERLKRLESTHARLHLLAKAVRSARALESLKDVMRKDNVDAEPKTHPDEPDMIDLLRDLARYTDTTLPPAVGVVARVPALFPVLTRYLEYQPGSLSTVKGCEAALKALEVKVRQADRELQRIRHKQAQSLMTDLDYFVRAVRDEEKKFLVQDGALEAAGGTLPAEPKEGRERTWPAAVDAAGEQHVRQQNQLYQRATKAEQDRLMKIYKAIPEEKTMRQMRDGVLEAQRQQQKEKYELKALEARVQWLRNIKLQQLRERKEKADEAERQRQKAREDIVYARPTGQGGVGGTKKAYQAPSREQAAAAAQQEDSGPFGALAGPSKADMASSWGRSSGPSQAAGAPASAAAPSPFRARPPGGAGAGAGPGPAAAGRWQRSGPPAGAGAGSAASPGKFQPRTGGAGAGAGAGGYKPPSSGGGGGGTKWR